MSKVLKIILTIVFSILAIIIFYFYFYRGQNIPLKKVFKWGVYTNAFAGNDEDDPYQPQKTDEQIKILKDLGTKLVRTNFEFYQGKPYTEVNNDFIGKLLANNFEVVLTVEPPNVKTYDDAYKIGKETAEQYKGKIHYYQLFNEVAGTAIKSGHPGNKLSDYDLLKYTEIKNITKGLADGITAGDSKAKKIISSNWVATAIVDELIKDDVSFDIVGWNWYSDMGDDPTAASQEKEIINIPKHFTDQRKEFWIVETNIGEDITPVLEQKQDDYLKALALKVKNSGLITGFIVFRLTDLDDKQSKDKGQGIIRLKRTSGTLYSADGKTYAFDQAKKFFETYKKIIAE